MRFKRNRSMAIGIAAAIFLVAFGLALAQQLFQVSRTVPAELAVFDTTIQPDGNLMLEHRDGTPVEGLSFRRFQIQPPLRQFNRDGAGTRRIFVTNDTEPPIRLFLSDPCHPAVDANTGQEIGFFSADLHAGAWWDAEAGRWNDDGREWAGGTCDNDRPPLRLMPGETFTMDIRLNLNPEHQNIEPTTINLEPVIIGGVGPEVPPQGQIHGRKFWDQNGNGIWDEGEPGRGGWVIYLDLNGDQVPDMETTTDRDGNYWFMNVPEGDFEIWEQPQPGWVQTYPTNPFTYNDFLRRNSVAEGFTFGNYLTASEIHGRKFNDRNNNGQWDEGEERLPGWQIAIDLDQDGTADRITTTNRDGIFWFMDLPSGPFDLWEVPQPGWVQTYPASGIHSGIVETGEIKFLSFGNYLTAAEIHGRKFRDLNGNGQWDDGEPFLQGWNIFLDLNNDGTADQTTQTNENGAFWFMDLPFGPYHLWEENRPGWTQTRPQDPGGYYGELSQGSIVRVAFGNELTSAQIHGRKYNDLNNSGGWDEGEPFLQGWEIALDLGDDGTADLITTTNEFGAYWFTNLPDGPFALWEVAQAGWDNTEPATGVYTGTLNAGDVLRAMLFGNHEQGPPPTPTPQPPTPTPQPPTPTPQPPTPTPVPPTPTPVPNGQISGMKLNDLNGNGQPDAGEPGLANWTINLDIGDDGSIDRTTTTDSNGNYTFLNVPPGEYGVSEQTQAGWAMTYPPLDSPFFGYYGGNITAGDTIGGLDFYNHQNLITNGSFEVGTPGLVPGVGAITSWAVEPGNVDLIEGVWDASDGVRSVDMNGNTLGTISQTFPTIAGNAYLVTFDLAGNTAPPQIKNLNVSAAGTQADFTFDTAGKSPPSNMGWRAESFSFVASGATSTLAFRSDTAGASGPAIDNVIVVDLGPAPDLTITLVLAPRSFNPGTSEHLVLVDVTNNNAAAVNTPFELRITLDSVDGAGNANGNASGSAFVPFASFPAGPFTQFGVEVFITTSGDCFQPECLTQGFVDWQGVVAETDEGNNTALRFDATPSA